MGLEKEGEAGEEEDEEEDEEEEEELEEGAEEEEEEEDLEEEEEEEEEEEGERDCLVRRRTVERAEENMAEKGRREGAVGEKEGTVAKVVLDA